MRRTSSKPSMGKKKVSFADDLGYCLTQVRIMTEASDSPPRLKPEILSTLAQGAMAGVTEIPPLVLTFKQPASDYLAFREKLNRDSVSLENVILKDYNLLGTVKVKNISFEKNVKVRCTFDSWESSSDIAAQYVPSQCGEENPFDTFSFQISVPPNFDVHKKVQFCVCFEANGQQFWDNNNGENYGVVSADWKAQNEQSECVTKDSEKEQGRTVFHLGPDSEWGEYSSWNYTDSSVPYW